MLSFFLQVGNDLNHQKLAELATKYGDVFMLKMGQRNLVVVSSPESAKDVLHTQGVAFGSRVCNVVFDIFSGHGNDVAFTNYGDHWRKMRRIMTVPFFTTKSVQGMHAAWVDEIDHVIEDLSTRPESTTDGVVIRTRLQLMIYNVMYRMMFNTRFQSEDDPLFVKLRALNLRRSQVTQSFDYNYGDFIPVLRPFLRGFLRVCRDVNEKRNAVFKGFLEDHK
jgi:trans-cinnamate 4-monooxygenase